MTTFETSNNAKVISAIEQCSGMMFVSEELYKADADGHKFKPGDVVELHGLEDYPEFNGEKVTISAIREDGQHGKAYYFKTSNIDLAYNLNWTYEYRLL